MRGSPSPVRVPWRIETVEDVAKPADRGAWPELVVRPHVINNTILRTISSRETFKDAETINRESGRPAHATASRSIGSGERRLIWSTRWSRVKILAPRPFQGAACRKATVVTVQPGTSR